MKYRLPSLKAALAGLLFLLVLAPVLWAADEPPVPEMNTVNVARGLLIKLAPEKVALTVVARFFISWMLLWGCAALFQAGQKGIGAALKVIVFQFLLGMGVVVIGVVAFFLQIGTSGGHFTSGSALFGLVLLGLALIIGSISIVVMVLETGLGKAIGIIIVYGIATSVCGFFSDQFIIGGTVEKIAAMLERDTKEYGETQVKSDIRTGKLVEKYSRELAGENVESGTAAAAPGASGTPLTSIAAGAAPLPPQGLAPGETLQQLQQRQQALYAQLTQDRKTLDTKNKDAVAEFNRRAAEYSALNARIAAISAASAPPKAPPPPVAASPAKSPALH